MSRDFRKPTPADEDIDAARADARRAFQADEIAEIARQHLGIETLEVRNRDRLDFHDIAVWSLREALEAAYEAGRGAMVEPPHDPGEGGAAR